MRTSTKRRYNSESRIARAAVTRRGILLAAKRLFMSKGFDKTSIDGIAAEANVSAANVYALFKSKEGILKELVHETVFDDRYRSLVDEAVSCRDILQVVRIATHIARMVHDAEESEIGLIRGASLMSPELRALELEAERIRYERQEFVIIGLKKENLLVDGLSLVHARDILWSLTSREIYRMLVVQRKWSSDEYETWLGKTILQTLVVETPQGVKEQCMQPQKKRQKPQGKVMTMAQKGKG